MNPVNHAVWSLEALYEALEGWISAVYSDNVHPGLEDGLLMKRLMRGYIGQEKENWSSLCMMKIL